MTITAQSGIFGFGLQTAKGSLPTTWYRTKALNISLGPTTEKEVAPPEIGGANNPTGAYKSGSFYGGAVTFIPRLEDTLGYLLLMATGEADAPVADANDTQAVAQIHKFHQKTGDATYIPWGGFRRYIPGTDATTDVGDIGMDCKVNSMVFNIPQVGPLTVEMNVTGRVPTLDDLSVAWSWANTYEEFDSVPMSMKGSIVSSSLNGGASLPATGARVSLLNNTTTVREERVIGSYYPDDFATRQRVLQIEWTYKWKDPELYRFIFNNGAANGDFAPCLTTTDFTLTLESPCQMPGSDLPWKLEIYAPKVDWRENGPVVLAGDDILQQNYVGIALENTAPENYFEIRLTNAITTQYA